jgi:hypothetical protein
MAGLEVEGARDPRSDQKRAEITVDGVGVFQTDSYDTDLWLAR